MNYPKLNTLEPQEFKGQLIKASGVYLKTNEPAVWIDKQLFHATIYSFRIVDTDKFLFFEFDAKGNFIR
jgi:hypothetical protein